MKRRLALYPMMILAAMALSPAGLLAHDGHGLTPASNAMHYLTEWVHGAPLVLLAAAMVIGLLYMVRKAARVKN